MAICTAKGDEPKMVKYRSGSVAERVVPSSVMVADPA